MLWNYQVAARLVAFRVVLSSMELVSYESNVPMALNETQIEVANFLTEIL
jgi:hypothetical protein